MNWLDKYLDCDKDKLFNDTLHGGGHSPKKLYLTESLSLVILKMLQGLIFVVHDFEENAFLIAQVPITKQ